MSILGEKQGAKKLSKTQARNQRRRETAKRTKTAQLDGHVSTATDQADDNSAKKSVGVIREDDSQWFVSPMSPLKDARAQQAPPHDGKARQHRSTRDPRFRYSRPDR
ncbi:unnamed protein product [Zymoseptoria tritici ST99CH_3D7]|uniref:Uncharacterized protein n=1 Tax=Zymoseptoria tritici (strain ST99CH_3D7) TaxID=1276538 RepID=A0A1X7S7J8_ZYMT9|nr:unnamed protein product [Zymoseptoria tritici ST99CH_3D7]